MSAPALTAVAGWDLPLLRGAVFTLEAVADRLPAWRARTEAVGRGLGNAECWYGPAAQAAAGALVEVSGVATAVTAALEESLAHARQLLSAADTAQDLAERALAAAAAVPVGLDDGGRLVDLHPSAGDALGTGLDADQTTAVLRAQGLAAEALDAAGRAGVAAIAAEGALAAVGVDQATGPAGFAALPSLLSQPPAPHTLLQLSASPEEAAVWWAGLSTAEREQAIAREPVLIGSLDGLPGWARDEANRRSLEEVLAEPVAEGHAVVVSVAAEIAEREAAGETVQLLQFQPQEELVVLAMGDVDAADSVVLTVPGMRNTAEGDLDELADSASALADAARAAAPGLSVASVAWFGYRPPMGPGALGTSVSREGGRALDRALDGLAASRVDDPARVVVSAHSYGTKVVDAAADAPGELAATAVVLNGSPGMQNDAAGLEVAEVYEASSPADPITWIDWHGEYVTWDDSFGAVELPTGPVMCHTEYYDQYFPTLAAIGEVVAGTREPG